jgi:uncharacterized protein YeaO (DUF488 family)
MAFGTVRRPPRGVAKTDWARRDFFDVWLPELAPSEDEQRCHRSLLRELLEAQGARLA